MYLRGFYEDSESLRDLASSEDEDRPPFWFYLLMPFISAFVGWWTNVIALRLTFYPYKFWGWEVKRWKGQPIGLFGWQGIVPTKAEKMARTTVQMMQRDLFDIQEVFGRVDKKEAAKHLKPGFEETLNRMVDKISHEYIIDRNTSWKNVESRIKQQITKWALDELPAFTVGFMGELVERLDEVYDMEDMVVKELTADPSILVSVFTTVGAKELKFIERSGAYLGFLFGCVQAILFRYALPTSVGDYILPILGFLVGYMTNWIALKVIFLPVDPWKIGPFTLQGLFLKRQREASKQFAIKSTESFLRSHYIWKYLLTGPKAGKFEKLLRKHADDFSDRLIGYARPLVEAYMGRENFNRMKVYIQDITVDEIEKMVEYLHTYVDEAMGLEQEITEKMADLPSSKFERVLHPIFEEDELKLIIVGAVLGAGVGGLQLLLSFALTA